MCQILWHIDSFNSQSQKEEEHRAHHSLRNYGNHCFLTRFLRWLKLRYPQKQAIQTRAKRRRQFCSTSCYSTGSQRPHHCWPLVNKVENTSSTQVCTCSCMTAKVLLRWEIQLSTWYTVPWADESMLQMISGSVQPFWHSARLWPTDRHIDRQLVQRTKRQAKN